jgi:hypothetical protein
MTDDLTTTSPLLDEVGAVRGVTYPHTSALLLLYCDGTGAPIAKLCVNGVPRHPSAELAWRVLRPYVLDAAETETALAVAINRGGPASVTATDRAWHAAAVRLTAEHGVRLIDVFLVTPATARALAPDDLR